MHNENGNNLAKILWYYNYDVGESESKKIICPFHGDVNPSLIVNFKDANWYCFGCGRSGDAFSFYKEMEKEKDDLQLYLGFLKVLKSKKCSDINISKGIKRYNKCNKDLYALSYHYYHGLKSVNWLADEKEDVKSLKHYMHSRGVTMCTLNKCKAKVTYNKNYPIVFPLLDNGKFKGWVCRTTSANIEAKRKYLYNEGFRRANTLVGNYGKSDFVFVTEGYFDRLKFLQFGYDNVVAILGWKASDNQILKLKEQGIKTIVSALDNDDCGRKGSEYLAKHFNVVRFSYLKGIKDPGEMNKDMFNKMLKKTIDKMEAK